MRSLFLPGALVLLAACGSSQAPPAATPAPAANVNPRSVGHGAGTAQYRVVSHVHQEQQMEGNKQQLNFLFEYFVTVTLSPSQAGKLAMVFLVDSLRADGGLLNPGEIARARGARLTGTLNADGQVTDLAGDSVLGGQLQTIATAARQFFPRLPAGGAEPGKQWTDTTDVKTSGSPQLSLHFVSERKVVDWTQHAGTRALRLDVTSHYTIEGTGQQMGQDFTLSGTGQRVTTSYLSADGRYLGATAADSAGTAVSLSALGITFPTLQQRADTVMVLP